MWVRIPPPLPDYGLYNRFLNTSGLDHCNLGLIIGRKRTVAKPKMRRETLSLSIYDFFDGSLASLAAEVRNLIEKYGEKATTNICVYSSDIELELTYEREETQKEMERRLKIARQRREREAKAKEEAKAERLKTFKNLAKEFGYKVEG